VTLLPLTSSHAPRRWRRDNLPLFFFPGGFFNFILLPLSGDEDPLPSVPAFSYWAAVSFGDFLDFLLQYFQEFRSSYSYQRPGTLPVTGRPGVGLFLWPPRSFSRFFEMTVPVQFSPFESVRLQQLPAVPFPMSCGVIDGPGSFPDGSYFLSHGWVRSRVSRPFPCFFFFGMFQERHCAGSLLRWKGQLSFFLSRSSYAPRGIVPRAGSHAEFFLVGRLPRQRFHPFLPPCP